MTAANEISEVVQMFISNKMIMSANYKENLLEALERADLDVMREADAVCSALASDTWSLVDEVPADVYLLAFAKDVENG